MGERRSGYRDLVAKLHGTRPLGRPRRRRGGNSTMDFRKWDGSMDWIELARNVDEWRALVNAEINFLVPYIAGNSLCS
jgi:hypothetical protein